MDLVGNFRVRVMSYYKAVRGLLVTDLESLIHGQGARMTSELVPLSNNFPTTPTGGRLSLDKLNVHRLLCPAGLQQYKARTHDMPATNP
ncbi:hypothetical protein TNCV_1147531 [Trichonephila clavipes]|nr:hypothetical protein TNCV_1147531 [Trichonephila clavipes]